MAMILTEMQNPLSIETTLLVWWTGLVISSTSVAVFEYPGNSVGNAQLLSGFFGRSFPSCSFTLHMIGFPSNPFYVTPSAML